MRFTRTARTAAVAIAAMAVAATSALSAQADAPFAPDANDVVMVGSDTSEFVLNDLSALYNSKTPTPTRRMASFNATGTSPIAIRPGVSIPRPNGSGAGITAVCTRTDIDAARSSRAKSATDCADSRFLRFATDQLRWAANDTTVATVPTLTDAQLTDIYQCDITDWHTINPAIPAGTTIKPFVPQANSGTRVFWATQVEIDPVNLPSCVKDTVNGTPVQEHTVDAINATPWSIVPISVGRYNLLAPAQQNGNYLGGVSTNTTTYDRTLYQVVKAVNNVVPAYLADLFGNGSGTSSIGGVPFICGRSDTNPATTTAGDIIKANGFLELPLGQCGRV